MIAIRVFRAIDELETCQKFIEGHMKILKVFGITMITSAKADWFLNPNTYVIIAEETETGKVMGGARVQIASAEFPLPIEKAVTEIDSRIHQVITDYSQYGTGELCGLWNSREVAGLGIGSIYLTRVAVSIAPMLKLKTLFALCASYTVSMAQKSGFIVTTFLGNNGNFYYPKEDLTATGMINPDTEILEFASPEEKLEILSLRNNVKQVTKHKSKRGDYELGFDLEIKNRL